MRHTILSILAMAATIFSAAADSPSLPEATKKDGSQRQTVGLVLSGGGARGIAHVGVIQALEDNDISIDYVTGTSMGAIVGGLYSCGYSPADMMRLFTSQDFLDWSSGVIAPENVYNFFKPAPTAKWLQIDASLEHGFKFQNDVLPGSLISPLPMNIEFMRLFAPYTEECGENFDKLFVPFRCVASNVYAKHKVVFSKGSVADAIRASMSFPMVFKPLEIDGTLLFDGGIYDNFPVDVMRDDFHPDIMIGVNVSEPDGQPIQNDLYSQLEDMIIQNNDYSLPAAEGIKIQVPVQQFAVLDFPDAKEIYDIGYRTGLEMVDSIKKRVSARTPASVVAERRREFAARTPEVSFDAVRVEGATPAQSRAIANLFTRRKRVPFNIDEATQSYYQAISTGKLVDLVPRAIYSGDSTTLLLRANVRNRWSLGVGGWITSSVHSMFYLSAGYRSLTLHELDVNLSGWVGQSYFAGMLKGRIMLPSVRPTSLELEGVASRSKYYDNELLFYQSSTPTFITDDELFARLTYSIASGRHGKFGISAAYGTMRDAYFASNDVDFAKTSRDVSRYRTAVIAGTYEFYTLDNPLYPTEGREFKAALRGIHESSMFLPEGQKQPGDKYKSHPLARVEASWRQFFPLHNNFHLGAQVQTVVTLGPLYQNYTATLVHSPAFEPTPSTRNYFMACLRSPSFVALGVTPIWIPMSRMQVRGDIHAFLPLRNVVAGADNSAHYSGWLRHPEFVAELAAVYSFPFADLSLYGNYITTPGHRWHFGVNFGLLFQAPRLLR